MSMVKKDFIQRGDLNAYIIAEYRRGRTVKSVSRDITHYTTDEAGGIAKRLRGTGDI